MSSRRSHTVPRLRRSCGCAASCALVARRRPLDSAFARKGAGSCSLHLSGTAAVVVIRFFSEQTLRLGRGIACARTRRIPVLRCPRPATAGVLGPGDPSARPPATSVRGAAPVVDAKPGQTDARRCRHLWASRYILGSNPIATFTCAMRQSRQQCRKRHCYR